jgi:hypothetical protein
VTDALDGRESLGQVDGAQGVLVRPERIRGCEQTLVRRHATVVTAFLRWLRREAHMYGQVPRGSNRTVNKAFAPEDPPSLCLKKPRSDPDQPTRD